MQLKHLHRDCVEQTAQGKYSCAPFYTLCLRVPSAPHLPESLTSPSQTMWTILVAAEKPFSKDATAKITQLGATFPEFKVVFLQGYKTRDELFAAIAEVDAIVVRSDKVDEALLERAKNLKIVVRAGAGYDTIDTAACTKRNIVVMSAFSMLCFFSGDVFLKFLCA